MVGESDDQEFAVHGYGEFVEESDCPRTMVNGASQGSTKPTGVIHETCSLLSCSRWRWSSTSAKVAIAMRPPMPNSNIGQPCRSIPT